MQKLTENQSISLESLRGLSAIIVLFAHVFQLYLARFYGDYYVTVALFAQSSVMVFFVMSGLLIGKSIQNNSIRNNGFNLASYTKSRAARIYPPLIYSVILALILSAISPYVFESGTINFSNPDSWINKGMLIEAKQVLTSITFTNGFLYSGIVTNSPLWSLPFEVWYYAIAGLFFTKRPLNALIAIMIFISISVINKSLAMYALVWFSGFLLSFLKVDSRVCKRISLPVLLVFAVALIYCGKQFVDTKENLTLYNTAFGLFFASFVYTFILCKDLRISILSYTAKFSYTLYITHFPILLFILGIFESKVLSSQKNALLYGLAALIIALISSYFAAKLLEDKKFISKII